MTKNWKAIAIGLKLDIPESDLEKIQSSLDNLAEAFHPLLQTLAHDIEPAVIFQCQAGENL
jgi:hypothetical protein